MNKKIDVFLKNKNNRIILIIFIIGAVFMLFPTGSKKTEKVPSSTEESVDYEQRLAEILSEIKGVGRVEVMVTYSESTENNPAYDVKTDKSDRGTDGYDESVERQPVMADGEPVILSKTYPKVKGVVVIAEGAGDLRVAADITDAVTTVFAIAPHKVCILERK